MKRLYVILLITILLAIPQSALSDDYKDGMKAYKEGDIVMALEFFIGQVMNKPEHQKSVDMIQEVLPKVIELRKSKAQKYSDAGQWDKAQKQYKRLESLNKILRDLEAYDNGQRVVWPEIDVGEAQSAATNTAAELAYQKGLEAMKTPGNADQAIEYFKEARKYDPDYKDSKELSGQAIYNDGMALINEGDYKGGVRILWKLRDFFPDGFHDSEEKVQAAIDSAKVKIAVMPFEDLTFRNKYGDVGLTLSSEIIAAGVASNPIFIDFVTRDYVYALLSEQDFGAGDRVDASTAAQIGKLIGVQVFVFGSITSVTPFMPKVEEHSGESSATIYQDGQKYPIYARWTKHKRASELRVTANYQILDVKTGRIIDANSFSKTASSVAQWVTFTGNEDAIEKSVKAYHTTGDVSVSPPEMLATDALRRISRDIAGSVLANYEQ